MGNFWDAKFGGVAAFNDNVDIIVLKPGKIERDLNAEPKPTTVRGWLKMCLEEIKSWHQYKKLSETAYITNLCMPDLLMLLEHIFEHLGSQEPLIHSKIDDGLVL